MNVGRHFTIVALGVALACMSAGAIGAEDISGLLETQGPEAEGIVTSPTIFRESTLPHLPITPRQIAFLIDHPRVALALAHLYAPFLDPYRIEALPDRRFRISEPGTLAGDAELIETRPGRRAYLITGYFDVVAMRFNGRIVLVTVYSEEREGTAVFVDATATAYIKIDSAFGGVFARLADFLFPKKVDNRIARLLRAAKAIADAVHRDPAGAYRKLDASGEVSAGDLREFGAAF